jgi:hypothetical protein
MMPATMLPEEKITGKDYGCIHYERCVHHEPKAEIATKTDEDKEGMRVSLNTGDCLVDRNYAGNPNIANFAINDRLAKMEKELEELKRQLKGCQSLSHIHAL